MAKGLTLATAFSSSLNVAPSAQAVEIPPETPFRILVLANLRGDRPLDPKTDRGWRPLTIDRDNFEEILARMRPTLTLDDVSADGAPIELEFDELDAFHPDRLIAVIGDGPVRGADLPATATSPAAAVSPLLKPIAPAPAGPPAAPLSGDALLDQMLGNSNFGAAEPESRTQSEFQKVLSKISAAHSVAPENLKQRHQQESAVSARLRAVLHHPRFRQLEAAWRSVLFLVRRLETDAKLQIGIVDCGKSQLADELNQADDLKSTGLYKLLCQPPAGSPAWALMVGDFLLGAELSDLETLGRLSLIAAQAGVPLVAGAEPILFGCTSLAQADEAESWQSPAAEQAAAWQLLRQFPTANWIGLTSPRFMLRLPYGPQTSSIQQQEFDEMPSPVAEHYVWGNSAFLVAYALASTFTQSGWRIQSHLQRDIADLPMHAVSGDDDTVAQPCVEAALVDRTVGIVADAGIIPIQAFRDGLSARVVRLCSIADPPAALAGRWQ